MTALAYAYGTAQANVNSTSTSFVDMSTSSDINAADLQGGEEYLIIARTLLNGNNGNQHFEMQIEAGGSEISGSSLSNSLIEPRRGGAAFGHEQMFLHRYTTPATPVDISQQYRAPTGYTVQSAHREILALKLGSDSDALTENSAFYWNEDTTSHTSLDNSAWTDTASVTIGDGSSDYLVLAVVHAEVNSTSQSLRVRIGGDVTGAPLDDYLELEGEDTAEVWNCGYSAVLEAPAASTVVTVQVQTDDSTSGAFDVTNCRLVAIRLDSFEGHTIRNTSTATALSVEDAWTELESNISLTTAAATRDVICWAGFGYTTGDTNKTVRLRIQDDALGNFPHSEFGTSVSNGSADRRYTYAIGINPGISASTSLSIDIDAMETADVSPAPTRLNTHTALFVTELAAPTSRDVTGTTEALEVTENAATVNRQRGVNAATEAITATENAAAINASRIVTCSTESVAVTESAATVNRQRGINAATETITVTENAASLNRTRSVTGSTEALEVTEAAATVNRQRGINASTEALAATEAAATVNRQRGINASTEALTLTEQSATVTRATIISCATEALTATEAAATINRQRGINAATESLTATENAASVSFGRVISCGTEALTATENAATVSRSLVISAATEAITATENAATVSLVRLVSCASEALEVAEQAATVNATRAISASTEALTLTEQSASVNLQRAIAAATEALSVTEAAASITTSRGVTCQTEALELTELAATVARSRTVTGSTEAITLTELAATIRTGRSIVALTEALTATAAAAVVRKTSGDLFPFTKIHRAFDFAMSDPSGPQHPDMVRMGAKLRGKRW